MFRLGSSFGVGATAMSRAMSVPPLLEQTATSVGEGAKSRSRGIGPIIDGPCSLSTERRTAPSAASRC